MTGSYPTGRGPSKPIGQYRSQVETPPAARHSTPTRPFFRFAQGWESNVPRELRGRPQWVVWRYEFRDGKWTKTPYRPHKPASKAKSNDPTTWAGFDKAVEVFSKSKGRFDGVGYVFAVDDPFCGIDLDHCLTEGGEILGWAPPYFDRLADAAYWELSPSGRGLKGIAKAELPGDGTRQGGFGPDGQGAVEVYDERRFFTITGYALEVERTEIGEAQGPVEDIYREIKGRSKGRTRSKGRAERKEQVASAADLADDDELIKKARAARNGQKFAMLFDHGDISAYAYDDSRADSALCAMVGFWTGDDPARVERIVNRSKLGEREKWQERADYRAMTIRNALDSITTFYDPSRNGHGGAAKGDGKGGATPPPTVEPSDEECERETVEDLWPKLGAPAFYGIAGEIVAKIDPHTESDPVATLVQFLVAFGSLIGRGPHFVVSATRHYLNMFAILLGLTALGRKGTSWDITRWTLQALDPIWGEQRIQAGLISGEGLIYHVRDASESRRRSKGGDEDSADAGVADKRLLVIETELGRVLKAMNRESNTLSEVIRQAWDTGSLRTMAKNQAIKATGAHVSIIGHATQADVRRHLTETDSANGFANRFLWVAVRRSKLLPEGGNLFNVNWAPFHNRLHEALDFAKDVRKMERDRAAKAMWAAEYEDLAAAKPGLLGAVLSRAEAQTMRLACLYALLDGTCEVQSDHLEAALALWDYCARSARLAFGDFGDPDAEKLLAALKATPEGLTRKQVTIEVFGRHKKAAEIARLLSELLTQGVIHRRKEESTGGRPAERWLVGRGPG